MPAIDSVPSPGSDGKPPRLISVQTRITLLLAVTAVAFVALLMAIQGGWHGQVDLLLHDRVHETNRVLRRVIDLRANGARLHADDYTRWDEFVAFVHDPKSGSHWANVNITQSIGNFDVDVAWVLNNQFDLVFTANPDSDSTLAALPIPIDTLAAALRTKPIRHFFVQMRGGLLELWTSPIQASDDLTRTSAIHGYYVVGRRWTSARLAELARDTEAIVHLVPPGILPPPAVVSSVTKITIAIPLRGIDGSPRRTILFESALPMVSTVYNTLRLSALLIFAGLVCAGLVLGLALTRWVGRPLATITEALHRRQPALLAASTKRRDELGHLARLVEEFFEQRRHLIEAREAANQAVAVKSQFLANISHELRTPMHGILSYSRFGVKGAMTAEREQLLDDFQNIESCGSSLLTLLDDLLDLSKLEAGRMRFELEPAPIDDVVGEALDEFASFYHEKGLRADVRVENTLDPVVMDRRKILQVIRNLLSNAGKFTPAGGTVQVRMMSSEGHARIMVEDSGTGIPEAELDLIFDNFAQASNAQAQFGGTGLGLAICREIVGAHAGRIWAENTPQGGARITVELPLAGPPVAAEPDAVSPEGKAAA